MGPTIISTRNGDDQYEVEISSDWISNESDWMIPVDIASKSMGYEGTTIVVGALNPGISETFGDGAKAFKSDLYTMVSTHYAYIIDKGFEVKINGDIVEPRTTKIVYDDGETTDTKVVEPYVFKTTTEKGVEVFLAVGFTRPIPSREEVLVEEETARYSSIDAGWTILCNDRAVIHCDRTELTGWGEARVPRYHPQFISISGIVEFRSKDPRELPTTTTKRGVDASSPLYLQIKNRMREGMKVFTDYTNKWKGRADESKDHVSRGRPLPLEELKLETEKLAFTSTRRRSLPGRQYKPNLPMPARIEPTKRRIIFVRELEDIRTIAEFIDEPHMGPSEIGEFCFDTFYEEASQ